MKRPPEWLRKMLRSRNTWAIALVVLGLVLVIRYAQTLNPLIALVATLVVAAAAVVAFWGRRR